MLITKNTVDALPEVIVSTLMLFEGKSMSEVLNSWTNNVRPIVENALKTLVINTAKGVEF